VNINKLLETIKDTSRDYVGTNGCLYQDITREELDLIVKEIERLNNIINELEEEISRHIALCTDVTLNDILEKLKELKEKE